MRRITTVLTPAMGKRLIGMGVAALPEVRAAMQNHRVLVVAGTTNAYVALELLRAIGDSDGFDAKGFYRGATFPKGVKGDALPFIGDVLIDRGTWVRGADVTMDAAQLTDHDIIMKGANAVNLKDGEAGVLIGSPVGGTTMPVISAAVGRRVQCLIPVGLEKRVEGKIASLAAFANAKGTTGPRLCPLPGQVFTELDAIYALTGAHAELLAGGGQLGAEGCCYLLVSGDDGQLALMDTLMNALNEAQPLKL